MQKYLSAIVVLSLLALAQTSLGADNSSLVELEDLFSGYFQGAIGNNDTTNISSCFNEEEAYYTMLLLKDCAEMVIAQINFSIIAESVISFYELNITSETKACLLNNQELQNADNELGVDGQTGAELYSSIQNWEQAESNEIFEQIVEDYNNNTYTSLGMTVASIVNDAINQQ